MKNIFLALLFISTSLWAQDYEKNWNKVIEYESDDKIKSANEIVNRIYKKAVHKADEVQIIKCFFYKSKYMQTLEEDAQSKILDNLKSEINKVSIPSKAILNLVYAKSLKGYLDRNIYQLYKRTKLDSAANKTFLTWTEADLENEIQKTYGLTLENETILKNTSLKNYEPIFDYLTLDKLKGQSLFDYLLIENISYFKSDIFTSQDDYKECLKRKNEFLGDSESFKKINFDFINEVKLKKVLSLYQKLEAGNSLEYQFERISFCNDFLVRSVADYQKALDALQKRNPDEMLLQRILLEKAAILNQQASKELHPDYNIKAIAVLDSIINIKNHSNAYNSALIKKQNILSKSLNIELQKYTYPNENTRVFINYKNVDNITLSFYKISLEKAKEFEIKNTKKRNDSLISAFISKNKSVTSASHPLINKKDYFNYTTEMVLPQLETGHYLVYFESGNQEKPEKAFTYETITVSDLMALSSTKDKMTTYQVLSRKTGKPIENVSIKSNTFETKTDKDGIAVNPLKTANYNYEDLQLSTINDTIYLPGSYSSYTNQYGEDEDGSEDFKSKVEFYLDRAIYRPGQTVYYKGIVLRKKNEKTKIAPNLLIKVILKDSNYSNVKEIEVTTNEFGSFSGEFILPKNGLTGEFHILAKEPDDLEKDPLYDKEEEEHPFWDYADLERSEINFKVEEYKRPKFEVTFEKIKEDFVVDQNISVKGNAKAFAGSTVSDAKVTYTIERGTYNSYRSYYPENNETIATGEVKTDASGRFIIDFTAKPSDTADRENLPIFSYKITVDVTDSNGETRSGETIAKAGYHSLILKTGVPSIVKSGNSDKIQITSTNLNDQFVAANGEIKIYFLREYSNRFKQRVFPNPEIETISKEDFNKLFPYETNEKPLTEKDKGELVFSKKVNTDTDKEIPLNFVGNYKSGYYRLEFSASDKQKNRIVTNTNFEINKSNGVLQRNKLITIEHLNSYAKKDGFIKLKITSSIPELHISATGHYKNGIFFDEHFALIDHQAIIKIPIKNEFINVVKIGFQSIFENQEFRQEYEAIIKTEEQQLEFETESFRNKIEPGSKESWSFRLKQKNTTTDAEILASMYDSSLDQFVIKDWGNLSFNEYNYNSVGYKSVFGFRNIDSNITNLNPFVTSAELRNEETKLMWFGFDFNEIDNWNISKEYKEQLTKKIKKPLNSKNIFGIVSDESGLPLPGVNVVVKGTQRGTQTDFDGSYEIEAANGEELVFSFMGMRNMAIDVNSNEINCTMTEDSVSLAEVVVTALGIKKKSKKSLGYSNIIIDQPVGSADKDAEIVDNSVLSTLSGKVAGINIINGNGVAGSSAKIVIRGIGSVTGSNEALIVIDGVISTADDLSKINAADLVSATVLKGAEAAAIYGLKASNGVIIITTKKGIQELTQVKARTNLSETAFFFPHLKTDNTGKVSFNFTSPEALTSWKMRLLAHNKEAVSGYLEKTVVTQKDLMVMPNFPRFLREKDTLFVSAKVANLTSEAKAGIAVLQLFDAATMEIIDIKMMNSNSIKNFTIAPGGNTAVTWKIAVPEGLQGVQYKILAKSGNHSDGEENIVPVLTNTILVTESIPIWVREQTKKEYAFENLKNNNSSTLRNHQFTFEYTSNPTWLAIQSLPYLMEYEHECAEQTFARFYANSLASEIISSNPKIAAVFEAWKKNGKLASKLEQNEELKSILTAETPWLLDAQSEEEKKNNLALLFDLDKMKNSQEQIFDKLIQKQKASGGFAWFDGGNENEYITRHILAGFGHLEKLNKEETLKNKIYKIAEKGVPFIDAKFLEIHKIRTENLKDKNKLVWLNPYSDLHYLYTRSFYLNTYLMSEDLKKATAIYLENIKANWTGYSLYEKGMAALILNRFGETSSAKKIIEGLKETASNNEDWGMYWIANKTGWYWYQAPIETQAMLIEAFAEVNNDTKSVDAMKVWLLKNKQAKNWPTTKSTTEAIYALLLQGTDWLSVKDNTVIKIGDEKMASKKMSENQKEAETGYLKLTWKAGEIKKEMASITVENKSKVPGFGGAYWQYFEDLDKIKTNADSSLAVSKELYIKKNNGKEEILQKITSKNPLNIGDLVTVRLVITSKEDMEFVHLKDMRASCFEPIAVLSEYKYTDGLSYYMSTKDTATHLFFDKIDKGTYIIEYDIRVNNAGNFSNGITTIQSMYAPEYASHTKGIRVTAKK